MALPSEADYACIVRSLKGGNVIPFLGAGVNRYGRGSDQEWKQGKYLPDGKELSSHLATTYKYPVDRNPEDLIRVAQYISVIGGNRQLYGALREVFNYHYPPTGLHRFLATLPTINGSPPRQPCPVIVTTNYDDLLERAFQDAHRCYDLLIYEAEGTNVGIFYHILPDGKREPITKPNDYRALSPNERTVILKMHGSIDPGNNPPCDSYVITEDHYIKYLTDHTNVSDLIPATVLAYLRNCDLLFLGYGMSDWNMRAILHNLWTGQQLSVAAWSIQLNPSDVDKKFWSRRGIDIFDMQLEDFVKQTKSRMGDPK